MKFFRMFAGLFSAALALGGTLAPADAALQFSTAARTAEASAFQSTLGGSNAGVLVIYGGATPSACGVAEAGTVLDTITLPTTAFTAASGAANQAGTWSGNATAAGTATHFEIQTSGGACVILGNVTTDLTLQNTSLAVGQTVTVTAFTITEGNQ